MKRQFKGLVVAIAIVGLALIGLVAARQFVGFNSPYPSGTAGSGEPSRLTAE